MILPYQRLLGITKENILRRTEYFSESDIDEIDQDAYPIVSLNSGYGTKERVVGVVRIYETEKRQWYGGRLGVDSVFRKFNQI